MSLQLQAARGLKWQMIEIAGRQFLGLAVFTTLARLLDPSAFGLMGLVGIYLAFVGMFVDQGIATALIQRKTLESQHINAAFWFNLTCAATLCLATIASAGFVATFFAEPRLEPLLRWASLALVVHASGAVHGTLFIREMDFRRPTIRTLIANVAGGVVGVTMGVAGYGVWSLVGQQLTSSIAGTCFLWIASSWRPSIGFSFAHLRQLMRVSASVFASGLLWFFSSRLDQIVIGRITGAGILGQYVIGNKLAEIARTAVHQPISVVSLPALSRLQGNSARLCQAIYKGMQLNSLVSFAVFGGLASIAPSLVPLVLGKQWEPAASLLQLLALYQLVVVLFVYCYPALLASGGPGKHLLVNTVCAAGTAMACFVGIRFGVHFVVVGLIMNITWIGLLALWFLRRRIGLSPLLYLRPCTIPFLAACAMFLAVRLLASLLSPSPSPWLALGLQVLLGGIVYLGVVLAEGTERVGQLLDVVNLALHRSARDSIETCVN